MDASSCISFVRARSAAALAAHSALVRHTLENPTREPMWVIRLQIFFELASDESSCRTVSPAEAAALLVCTSRTPQDASPTTLNETRIQRQFIPHFLHVSNWKLPIRLTSFRSYPQASGAREMTDEGPRAAPGQYHPTDDSDGRPLGCALRALQTTTMPRMVLVVAPLGWPCVRSK